MDQEKQEKFENRVDLSALSDKVGQVKEEIAKLIIGQHEMVDLLLTALLANGHVLIEGVPGVAKTMTAKIFSKILSVGFSRIQFTPDLMPSDLLGTNVFNQKTSEFEFRKGPVFSNIILIDEINRAPAKTQAALFEVMEEQQVTMDGTRYPMAQPFLVLATQNPIEQEGTYRLPEAQLDRFIFKIEVNYPNLEEEILILETFHHNKNKRDLNEIKSVLSPSDIREMRSMVSDIVIEKEILNYIAHIVHNTRENKAIYLGGSPRASLAIMTSSKAYAAIQGRDFVTPDDVKAMVMPVLNHRLILTPEQEMEGASVNQVVGQILKQVEVPR